jgi:hypothetical protein
VIPGPASVPRPRAATSPRTLPAPRTASCPRLRRHRARAAAAAAAATMHHALLSRTSVSATATTTTPPLPDSRCMLVLLRPLAQNPCIRFGHTIPTEHHVDAMIVQESDPSINHTWTNFKVSRASPVSTGRGLALTPPARATTSLPNHSSRTLAIGSTSSSPARGPSPSGRTREASVGTRSTASPASPSLLARS